MLKNRPPFDYYTTWVITLSILSLNRTESYHEFHEKERDVGTANDDKLVLMKLVYRGNVRSGIRMTPSKVLARLVLRTLDRNVSLLTYLR